MTGWPPFCGPGWLLAYATGGSLWILIFGLTLSPLFVVLVAAGALGITALGSLFDSGHVMPPEKR